MYEHMRRISIAVTFAAYNSGRSVQIPHVAYAEFRFALDLNGRVLFLDCTAACWGITLGGASSPNLNFWIRRYVKRYDLDTPRILK